MEPLSKELRKLEKNVRLLAMEKLQARDIKEGEILDTELNRLAISLTKSQTFTLMKLSGTWLVALNIYEAWEKRQELGEVKIDPTVTVDVIAVRLLELNRMSLKKET